MNKDEPNVSLEELINALIKKREEIALGGEQKRINSQNTKGNLYGNES